MGSAAGILRPLHVGRYGHRVQPVLQPAPAALGRSVERAPEGPPHHAGRSRGRAGRLPAEAAAFVQLDRPATSLRRAEREAIAQKPLLRAYLNAEFRDQLVAGDVLVAHSWATTAQQAIDAAPQLAFAYPAEGFPLYCDNAVVLRESRRSGWRTSSWITCCGAVAAAIVESARTATANAAAQALLPDATRTIPRSFPPPRFSAAAIGRGRCRPLPSACATGFGRRSKRRE